MKALLSSLLPLVAAPALFADVAIYNGSTVVKTTSADGSGTTVAKTVEILDLTTGETQSVVLEKKGKSRSFTVEPAVATSLTTVSDSRNKKISDVVAFAATTTDATTTVTTTTSILLKGKFGPGKGKNHAEVVRQFQGVISVVSSAGTDPADQSAIAAALVISTPVLNLNSALSKAANDAGHVTVPAALDDVKAALAAAGYTEVP